MMKIRDNYVLFNESLSSFIPQELSLQLESFTTSTMDCHSLHQKVPQRISVMKTNIDALLARGSKGNGNYWPKSEQQDKGFPNTRTKSEYLGILFPTTRIEASNSQLPLEPLANSDIPLVVIIDLLLLKNITKSEIHS